MDGVFETLLGLLPVAAFIAYRIIAARRKQAAAQRQVRDAAPLPVPEAARPAITAAYIEDDAEPVFSAWELSANDPPPAPQPQPAEPSRAPSFTEPEPAASAALPQGTFSAPAFPENLRYLPPLKQALVLTEILGPPKAW